MSVPPSITGQNLQPALPQVINLDHPTAPFIQEPEVSAMLLRKPTEPQIMIRVRVSQSWSPPPPSFRLLSGSVYHSPEHPNHPTPSLRLLSEVSAMLLWTPKWSSTNQRSAQCCSTEYTMDVFHAIPLFYINKLYGRFPRHYFSHLTSPFVYKSNKLDVLYANLYL